MARAFSIHHFPAFRSNLFVTLTVQNPVRVLQKGFPLQSGLDN
jgi:hypothetical protein